MNKTNEYEKIHQHIQYALEEREIKPSLFRLFEKHKILSFKFWRLVSAIALLPYCISTIGSTKNIILQTFNNGVNSSDPILLTFIFCFSIVSFFAPILISSIALTHYLPLYKLSQKKFFKKHFSKYLRKFPILASSCDTLNYKEDFLLNFSNDKNLNFSMSSYYQYLLQFPFSKEIKQSLAIKQKKLFDIDLNPEKYQKNFTSIVNTFLADFENYAKSPIILKFNYEEKLQDYEAKIFYSDYISDYLEEPKEDAQKDSKKKLFKEML